LVSDQVGVQRPATRSSVVGTAGIASERIFAKTDSIAMSKTPVMKVVAQVET